MLIVAAHVAQRELKKGNAMNKSYSTGGAARRLKRSRDSLSHAFRAGAPEPETPRIAGRRMFSEQDIERLREWFASRQRGKVAV